MKAYSKEIDKNVVAYIAKSYAEAKGHPIVQLLMYKILALFDFQVAKDTGVPCTDFHYSAYQRGPVPIELYKSWQDNDLVKKVPETINNHKAQVFIAIGTPDMDYISEYEKSVLDSVILRAVKWNTSQASKTTHKEIKAWFLARVRKCKAMKYSDEFDGFETKSESDMSLQEQRLLRHLSIQNA